MWVVSFQLSLRLWFGKISCGVCKEVASAKPNPFRLSLDFPPSQQILLSKYLSSNLATYSFRSGTDTKIKYVTFFILGFYVTFKYSLDFIATGMLPLLPSSLDLQPATHLTSPSLGLARKPILRGQNLRRSPECFYFCLYE